MMAFIKIFYYGKKGNQDNMDTVAPIRPEVKVLVTYPLINDHIFTNEPTTVDKVPTAGFNIPIGSRL